MQYDVQLTKSKRRGDEEKNIMMRQMRRSTRRRHENIIQDNQCNFYQRHEFHLLWCQNWRRPRGQEVRHFAILGGVRWHGSNTKFMRLCCKTKRIATFRLVVGYRRYVYQACRNQYTSYRGSHFHVIAVWNNSIKYPPYWNVRVFYASLSKQKMRR